MGKKKRATRSPSRNIQNERPVTRSVSPKTGSNVPYLIIISALLLVIAYLLAGGGGQKQPSAGPSPLPGNDPAFFPGDAAAPNINPDFAGFFPVNISGMRRVALQNDMLNEETGGTFSSNVVDRASIIYISSSPSTDFDIEYSVYKMKTPEAASEVLNHYSSSWNNIPAPYGDITFWVWKGYSEQLQTGNIPRPAGASIYWDTLSDSAFIPTGGRRGTYYISEINQNLYCMHGETAIDEYFIMVDVHAPAGRIESVADQMFSEAAKQITSLGI